MPKMSGRSKKSRENCVTAKVMLKKGFKPTATAYLQIFGSGAGDTSPSVFLFADSQRYRTEDTEVQLLINYAYFLLSQCAKERPSPPWN